MLNLNINKENKIMKKINLAAKNTFLLGLILSTTGCFMCGKSPNFTLLCFNERNDLNLDYMQQFGSFPTPSNLKIVAENNTPGQSTAFSASAFIPAGALQPYEAIIRFPPAFTVSPNGFAEISPVGTNIGTYEIDLNEDGIAEASFPIISESNFFAWMDVNKNNMKDFSEPEIFQSQDIKGNKLLVTTVPNGGDNSPTNNIGNISYKMNMYLKSGLFINPTIVNNHSISASIQSVDPDTGGMNNGSGLEPESIDIETPLLIDLIFKNEFE